MIFDNIVIKSDNDSDLTITLNLTPNPTDEFVILDIDGLTDQNRLPQYQPGTTGTVDRYITKPAERDVEFTIRLNPNFSLGHDIHYLRRVINRVASGTKVLGGSPYLQIQYRQITNNTAVSFAIVTGVEYDLFSATPTCKLRMRLRDQFLRAFDQTTFDVSANSAVYTISELADSKSDAYTGIQVAVTLLSDQASLTFDNSSVPPIYWQFKVEPVNVSDGLGGYTSGFKSGETLEFGSGLRDGAPDYCYVTRSGEQVNLIDQIAPGSWFPEKPPGAELYIHRPSTVSWVHIKWYTTYWGL